MVNKAIDSKRLENQDGKRKISRSGGRNGMATEHNATRRLATVKPAYTVRDEVLPH